MLIKAVAIVGLFSGTGAVISQFPTLPKDFQSWPATAILGFICFLSICSWTYLSSKTASANIKSAEAQGKIAQALTETNRRLDELCDKVGRANEHQAAQVTETKLMREDLNSRPCIMGSKQT